MVDYRELMGILSVPRPNGSASERETEASLRAWLSRHNIPYEVHSFLLYPYFFECVGIWLILSRTLLAIAIWERWGWVTLPVALIGLAGGTLDVALNLPLVTWPGARRRNNLVIPFESAGARQEILLCAHYDSKTELLDHHQRMFFFKRLKFGIALTMLLGVWGWVQQVFTISAWSESIFWMGVALTAPMLLLAWGLGLHLSLGRFVQPSQGAVDNGAACAILLGLAERLAGNVPTDKKVTLVLFTGEEVNMQGSRAYVRSRAGNLPAAVLNLEVMAQDGDFVYWEQDGNAFRLTPTAGWLNRAVAEAVGQVAGRPARPAGPMNSDGSSFLFAGIPAATIGTFDTRLGQTGFHRPSDCLERVVLERLPLTVEVLETFLRRIRL